MIFIFVPSMGPILILLLSFFLVGSAAFGVYFGITHTATSDKEDSKVWKDKTFSTKQLVMLIINLIVLFSSVLSVIIGFIEHNSALGTTGIICWIITALIASHICSPLRLLLFPTQWEEGNGCGYFLYAPILIVASVASLVLILLTSWLFALIVILKNLTKKARVLTALILLVSIALVLGVFAYSTYSQQKLVDEKAEYTEKIKNESLSKIKEKIDSGKVEKVEFSEDELSVAKEMGYSSIFKSVEARKLVSEKFCEFYKKQDFEGLLNFVDFLQVNSAGTMIGSYPETNICFTGEFINFMKQYVVENGAPFGSNDICNKYLILGREIWIEKTGKHLTIKNKEYDTYVQLGTYYHMVMQAITYSEEGSAYFLVGDSVEFFEYFEPAFSGGDCSRCSGTGKVTKHFGKSWNDKPGYIYGKKCGACDGTGWEK